MDVDISNMIQITNGKDSNWSIYLNEESGIMYSMANDKDCNNSQFGDLPHLIKMIRKGFYQKEQFTEAGLKIIGKNKPKIWED